MIQIPDPSTLQPQIHPFDASRRLLLLRSDATELVRVDFLFEAGSSYQPKPLCAAAANKLMTVATQKMDAARLAEYLDYRGAIVETSSDVLQTSLTVYTLRRFAEEVLVVVGDMIYHPQFGSDDFSLWCKKKSVELATLEGRSQHIARRLFYQTLFGTEHPLGRYAIAADAARLEVDTVRDFHKRYYVDGGCQVILSGHIDDGLIEHIAGIWHKGTTTVTHDKNLAKSPIAGNLHISAAITDSVQTSLRIGRQLPFDWSHPDYAPFMILTTLLGGYFGSRLMSNLREDKGYTYGIQARTQIYRGCIVFYIAADVAAGKADAAEQEIVGELRRLMEEKVEADELLLVKTVLAADFVRSIDGIFERAARLCDMHATDVTEQLTQNLCKAIETTTAVQLQELAQRLLNPETMVYCRAGAE